jgi:hypothetical protein
MSLELKVVDENEAELFAEVDALIFKRRKLDNPNAPEIMRSVQDHLRAYTSARDLLAECIKKTKQDAEKKEQDDLDGGSSLLLTVQNNMCHGSGFRQDMQYLVAWRDVKNTIIGKLLGPNVPDFLYVSTDMSIRSSASEEDKQMDACVDELMTKGHCIYDAEMDDIEGAKMLNLVKSQKNTVASRFVIYRTFS